MREDFRMTMSRVIRCDQWWFREFCAEFLGSVVLVAMGNGAVAQMVFEHGKFNSFLSVNIAYAMALMFAVYIAGEVSGGHINPAITLAMCFLGKTRWRQLPVYFLAQYFGCFVGSCLVYILYLDAISNLDGGTRQVEGPNATAGIFATYPLEHVSAGTLFLDQAFGAAVLALCILALTDSKNMEVPKFMIPVGVGLALLMIGTSYGINCGYAINPARDFAPRLFTFLTGWGPGVFSFRNYNWFWIPIVAPHVGAVLGALAYEFLIGVHWPSNNSDPDDFPGNHGQITLTAMPTARRPTPRVDAPPKL